MYVASIPKLRFRSGKTNHGPILTKVYEATVKDMVEKIEDDGFFHTSKAGAPLFIEGKLTGKGTHHGVNWIRDTGQAIRELAHLRVVRVKKACLWFTKHFLNDPPRWNRCMYRDGSGYGKYETDGQALVLLGLLTACKYFDDPPWREKVWNEGCKPALAYFDYASNNSRFHHLLFAISEASDKVRGSYDIYSNTLACDALRLAAPLLETRNLNARLLRELEGTIWRNVLTHLTSDDRKTWIHARFADGQAQDFMRYDFYKVIHFQHVLFELAPLFLAPDTRTYDPVADMLANELRLCRNTFWVIYDLSRKWLEAHRVPHLFVGNAWGMAPIPEEFEWDNNAYHTSIQFGHGLFTQAALLLDEMDISKQAIETIALGCDNPEFGKKWRYVTPQNFYLDRKGNVRGSGDIGNLTNDAENLKILRIMIGVDDNSDKLRVMPRMPAGWGMEVGDYPVSLIKGNTITHNTVSYRLRAEKRRIAFSMSLKRECDDLSVRLGPIPKETKDGSIQCSARGRIVKSGDSQWVVCERLKGKQFDLECTY